MIHKSTRKRNEIHIDTFHFIDIIVMARILIVKKQKKSCQNQSKLTCVHPNCYGNDDDNLIIVLCEKNSIFDE